MTTLLKNKVLSIEKILFDIPGKITLKLEDGRTSQFIILKTLWDWKINGVSVNY